MPKFRTKPFKPVLVEARQWKGTWDWAGDDAETIAWVNRFGRKAWRRDTDRGQDLMIEGEGSTLAIKPGWWVIQGAVGFRGCPPEIFRGAYEPVPEPEARPVEVSLEAAMGTSAL